MLIDSTLREGEQRYGVYFSHDQRVRLATYLTDAGVDELELGTAGREDLSRLIAEGRRLQAKRTDAGLKPPALSIWCAARHDHFALAQAMEPDIICMGVPVSDAHLARRLNTTRAATLEKIRHILTASRTAKARVSIGLEDATRADPDFVLEAARTAQRHGAFRVRLSDTLGTLTPIKAAALMARFAAELTIPLALHCHDDFGLATANAITALDSGAAYVDGALYGLGERAGIARTEQLVAFLALQRDKPYTLQGVCRGARYLDTILPKPSAGQRGGIDPHAPIVGNRIFHCETGLHIDGIYKHTELYEPYSPRLTGHSRVLSLGKKTGNAAVRHTLRAMGYAPVQPPTLEAITSAVREAATRVGRPLSDAESREIFEQHGAERAPADES